MSCNSTFSRTDIRASAKQVLRNIDHDWGYRPVGNALLAFGKKGEAILQSFIDQTTDRKLAINAWKSLYIRQKPGLFSEVTEKENAAAMRQRPLFLKKPVVPRLQQNFDDEALWKPQTRAMVGDVNTIAGRWGELFDTGPNIVTSDGGQALRIRRGGASFSGQAVPALTDDADYQLSFRLYRETEQSALIVQLRGLAGQSFQNELALNITESGAVRFMDFESEKWIDSDLDIPSHVWTQVTILANRRTRSFEIAIQSDGENRRHSTVPGLLTIQPNLRNIVFIPQPPDNSATRVDDIALTEVR